MKIILKFLPPLISNCVGINNPTLVYFVSSFPSMTKNNTSKKVLEFEIDSISCDNISVEKFARIVIPISDFGYTTKGIVA